MSFVNESLEEALNHAGHSMTKVRHQVFDLLLEQEPQTMQQLLKRVAGRLDRASLYRTIKLFEQIGVVHKVYIGWKYRIELTDEFSHHHHHLSCLRCGHIVPIHDNEEIETFVSRTVKQYGFVPKQHQFEVYGICRQCQNPSAKPVPLA